MWDASREEVWRGELAGLCWEDIDLAARELTIREQVIVVDGVEGAVALWRRWTH